MIEKKILNKNNLLSKRFRRNSIYKILKIVTLKKYIYIYIYFFYLYKKFKKIKFK